MTERFMIDTCGTLIDKETAWCYDYVSEVKDLMNNLEKENKQLKSDKNHLMGYLIRIKDWDDEMIDDVLHNESYEEYGELYYEWKKETEQELKE